MTAEANLKIEYWKLSKIKPDPDNPRHHSEQQVAQVRASMQEFGFTNPLLVDPAGRLIAGHGRYMAAESGGFDPVPVIVLKGLTDAQRRAYMIADNQLTIAGAWDFSKLGDMVRGLANDGFDVDFTFLPVASLEEIFGGGSDMRQGDDDGNTSNTTNLQYLRFDKMQVALSDAELAFLKRKLDAHVEANGVTTGFIRSEFMGD